MQLSFLHTWVIFGGPGLFSLITNMSVRLRGCLSLCVPLCLMDNRVCWMDNFFFTNYPSSCFYAQIQSLGIKTINVNS